VYGIKGGPCYRCLFPKCPPKNSIKKCKEAGILGMIPGIIGILEAIEVVKIILNCGEILN